MYKYFPAWIQDVAVSCKGLLINRERYGKDFINAYRAYTARGSWSEDRIFEYREKKRVEALQRASLTPYYGRLFHGLGATWQDFIDIKAFSTLPVIKKVDLQAGVEQFKSRAPLPSDRIVRTSGTTGTSLAFPISRNVEADQWAVWWRYRGWHGIQRGNCCGLFASAPVVIGMQTERPYRFNWANNEIRFSIFHISNETAHLYVDALNKHRPTWIHGNPSAIALLARYINEQALNMAKTIRTVTIGSENLHPWHRQSIIDAFGVIPRQHYGLVEAVANISECEAGRLHVDEDFSYIEFINESGVDDGAFSIVGTGFSNTALSFLRYQTGDLAKLSNMRCECGRAGRIVESLDGRITDYIVLPGGKRVASLAGPFHATDNLAAAQLYQDKTGQLTVRYVPGAGWRSELLSGLEARLRLRVGNEVPISFEQVKEIPKTSRGKTKLVVSDYFTDV